LLELSCALFVI